MTGQEFWKAIEYILLEDKLQGEDKSCLSIRYTVFNIDTKDRIGVNEYRVQWKLKLGLM